MYNEALQMDPNNVGLREDMAWPARPQDTYGLEKLYAEEMALAYAKGNRCVVSYILKGRANLLLLLLLR